MNNHQHVFMFDVNYSFGGEGVFTNVDREELGPFPPIQNIFLLLEEGPFTLLDGTDFNLL